MLVEPLPKVGCANSAMVQGIEKLGAKLHLHALRDRGGFRERDVEIGQARTAQRLRGMP